MPDPDRKPQQPARPVQDSVPEQGPLDEAVGEEEKVLTGRPDANMPALLTRDVPGG